MVVVRVGSFCFQAGLRGHREGATRAVLNIENRRQRGRLCGKSELVAGEGPSLEPKQRARKTAEPDKPEPLWICGGCFTHPKPQKKSNCGRRRLPRHWGRKVSREKGGALGLRQMPLFLPCGEPRRLRLPALTRKHGNATKAWGQMKAAPKAHRGCAPLAPGQSPPFFPQSLPRRQAHSSLLQGVNFKKQNQKRKNFIWKTGREALAHTYWGRAAALKIPRKMNHTAETAHRPGAATSPEETNGKTPNGGHEF